MSDFFVETMGKVLCPENPSGWYKTYPHRVTKGVMDCRIGNTGFMYAVNQSGEGLAISGMVNAPSNSGIAFVQSSPEISARREVALWLISHAKAPFIVGEIGKADPVPFMKTSKHELRGFFCSTSSSFTFDLLAVRKAFEAFRPWPWKKVATAIHAHEAFSLTQDALREARLLKALEAIPGVSDAITDNPAIKPGSGNYTILSWANIEK